MQEPGGEKGLTPGQDLVPKLPSLLPLVGLHTPLALPQKAPLLRVGRCVGCLWQGSLWGVGGAQYCCKQQDLALGEKRWLSPTSSPTSALPHSLLGAPPSLG